MSSFNGIMDIKNEMTPEKYISHLEIILDKEVKIKRDVYNMGTFFLIQESEWIKKKKEAEFVNHYGEIKKGYKEYYDWSEITKQMIVSPEEVLNYLGGVQY